MSESAAGPSRAMLEAMSDLWRLRPPGPDNIFAHPAFKRLREVCRDSYSNAGENGPNFALSIALQALGLPCDLQKGTAHLALPIEEAAHRLDEAMRLTHAKRIHLVPLNLAADLPSIAFGPARIGQLTADELRTIVDETRLKRFYPQKAFDAERFSEFHWLIVEEMVKLDQEPEARAVPFLFMDLSQDLGQIEPHKGQFPDIVEEALFFLLLAPWEKWSTMEEVDWRGFRVPWIYTIDSDIFVRLNSPPSPDTLSWQPQIYDDGYGGIIEEERPAELRLKDEVATELPVWDQNHWAKVKQAKESVLFETPITHFLVRAFLAKGVDEFLAHITMIEAALGLHADYKKKCQHKCDRYKRMSPTERIRGRIAGLLDDRCYADKYEGLFNLRCTFLHGRTMTPILTKEQVMARSLARKVVEALIHAAQSGTISSRKDFLDDLLNKGAPLIQPKRQP
ncbi:hypothetical protein [Eilatimonas milleporae]|uniref:Apea-like HEPN domain-containing protein n=1 Tax=Eilatimonas milleporae TaxID=911205 RepID=A0A3M0C272_9PROT|nr:hypothetical protein [Eilatimonas milleporae]RMB02747.1 hypothetical protein BXY39_3098 [Eilatimonas milleporae]